MELNGKQQKGMHIPGLTLKNLARLPKHIASFGLWNKNGSVGGVHFLTAFTSLRTFFKKRKNMEELGVRKGELEGRGRK